MQARLKRLTTLGCVVFIVAFASTASSQTYRQTWTTTEDFSEGAQVNVNATDPRDQLQLNLGQIETPYLWVANSGDSTVSQIDTATGQVLSVTEIPRDPGGFSVGPSRTAVDLDFNCWVALRNTGNAFVYKLSAETGEILGRSPYVGGETRGVAINAQGEVWVSSSRIGVQGDGYGWSKIDPAPLNPNLPPGPNRPYPTLQSFESEIGSYGIAIDPFGKIYSTTGWLPLQGESFRSIQRVDGDTGEIEQRWRLIHNEGDIYGLTVDIDGNVWGPFWPGHTVARIRGSYECPNGASECIINPITTPGAIQEIDILPILQAEDPTLDENIGGRGVAVDANGFVWAVFNRNAVDWEQTDTYVVKIDATTNTPIQAVRVGQGAVGITPDANGFIWVVNHDGGGANFQSGFTCPNNFDPNEGGTVTKLRSSDGSVVATYPTCGRQPYTYSDMAGYNLRSVALRSGTWRVTHDSGRPGLEWERVNWRSQESDDTTFRVRVRASDTEENLASQPFVTVSNNDDMPLDGQFIEVEAFFFTRNDSFGPVLEDLTISSVCMMAPEVCNGLDDDCDGNIDNGNPGGGAVCDTGLEGVCGEGVNTCVNGEYECVTANTPVNEVCDGEDNNCNGLIDEGVSNLCGTCGPTPMEVCDGEDNDCDGLFDEGVLNACGSCGAPPMEVCDEQDNDCDGLFDEGVLNACGSCGPEPVEVCDGEDNDCDGLTDEDLLNACGECGPTPVEVCDLQDNDCDEMVDEAVLNSCGFCGEDPVEICDGVDNDCDEQVDEGLLNACGNCGDLPGEVCNGFDDDCDGETDEGVLNSCGGCGLLPEEICDGADNNCNGEIDEGVLNACGGCGELGPDLCDGEDTDCDGEIDEDPECAEGRACVNGECAEECAQGECPRGFVCLDDYCLVDECIGRMCPTGQQCFLGDCLTAEEWPCRNVDCEGDLVCIDGSCVDDPCDTTTCGDGEQCYQGSCRDEAEVACLVAECEAGEVCENGACIPDPCQGVTCEGGEICEMGDCIDACERVDCQTGFTCTEGTCQLDPCFNVTCDAGQLCDNGNCVWEACVGTICAAEEQCGPNGCEPEGTCGDSVCMSGEICFNGTTCIDPDNPPMTSGGTSNTTDGTGDTTDGTGDGGGSGSGGGDEGCGCTTVATPTPAPPYGLLLALGALAGALIRRRP